MSAERTFQVNSDAVDANGFFDPRYTGDFDNSSPELRWDGAPDEARTFALIAEDPDAPKGLFTHWVIYNIPAHIRHLPAGIPAQETLPNGIRQGVNNFGKLGYGGPYPPVGDRPHRYFFRIYALDATLSLPAGAKRAALEAAMNQHVVGKGETFGTYRAAP